MTSKLSGLTSKDAVLEAISECDRMGREEFLKHYGFRRSRLYPLIYNETTYDSKAIVGAAYGKQHGVPLGPHDFSGGVHTVVPLLRKLGFLAGAAQHPTEDLEIGSTYLRKNLLEQFGGQLQRGIWTPKEFPVVFLFTGKSGKQYGYEDGWSKDGTFAYTGEGPRGDMTFTSGNAAIRDHRSNGKDLLLFEDLGKGKGVRYLGMFDCAAWQTKKGMDVDNRPRNLLVFDLVPIGTDPRQGGYGAAPKPSTTQSLDQLRQAALRASRDHKPLRRKGSAKASWHERSRKVRDYVLARSNGICEACDKAAPFVKRNGDPYLEPHHTQRLADDGPDDPAWVGAICPNCHRRIHSGLDGKEWNKKLQVKLQKKEGSY